MTMAMIPLKYSFRNLLRRRLRTSLTVLGLGLALSTIVFMLAFSRSLGSAMRQTGDPDNLIIISKKAQDHVLSSIAAKDCDLIKSKLADAVASVSLDGAPRPLISLEVYIGINVALPDADNDGKHRAVIHGVDPQVAMKANRLITMVKGNLPRPGANELICGITAGARTNLDDAQLAIGKKLHFANKDWTIVGLFKAPGTLMESEIWTHANDLRVALKRTDYSFIRCKLKDPGQMAGIIEKISTDEQFQVKAFSEQTYFADFASGFDYFRHFALILTALIIIGGVFTGMNTMYAAIMGRIREIGTLQVIGFSKTSVLVCILVESTLIAITGAFVGILLGMAANGIPMRIPMAAFRVKVDMVVIAWTFVAAFGIGILGALIPACRALKLKMIDAVRYE